MMDNAASSAIVGDDTDYDEDDGKRRQLGLITNSEQYFAPY